MNPPASHATTDSVARPAIVSVPLRAAPSFDRCVGPRQVAAVIRTLLHDPAHVGAGGQAALLDCMEPLLAQSGALAETALAHGVRELERLVAQVDPSGVFAYRVDVWPTAAPATRSTKSARPVMVPMDPSTVPSMPARSGATTSTSATWVR